MLEEFTAQLTDLKSLTSEQAFEAVELLTEEAISADSKANFLIALAHKGETIEEIAAFARALRAKSIVPPLDPETRSHEILDVVGTGGDRLGTFNISTTVAIICAAAGTRVAKHGNRAATSKCGSADVLEALGVPIHLPPAEAAQTLREKGFAFFFAPDYHPAFKHVATARKLCAERGQTTIFNFLGPLLNPVQPSAMLLGVPRPELCEPIARVLQTLGLRRAMVVCGSVAPLRTYPPFGFDPGNRLAKVRILGTGGTSQVISVAEAVNQAQTRGAALVEVAPHADPPICALVNGADLDRVAKKHPQDGKYLDELSTVGENTIAEFYQERGFATSRLLADRFPIQFAALADLLGTNCEGNALIVQRLLDGEDRGPKRDAVLLNAAAALFVAGLARNLTAGWDLAAEVIDSGCAARKLVGLRA